MDIKRMQEIAADYARYTRQADKRAIAPLKELYTAGLESPSTTRIIICDAGRYSGKCLENIFKREAVEIGLKEASKNFQQGLINTAVFGKLIDKSEGFFEKITSWKGSVPKEFSQMLKKAMK